MGALETCDEDQIRAQLEVDLIAPILMTRTLLPEIRKAHGTIINVSSMMGFVGFPLSSTYCASKGGLSMFTEALYHEMKAIGVRVALVEPGGFRTNFAENTRWGNQPIAAYEKLTSDGQKIQAKLSSGNGKSPKLVAERIVRIADGEINSARSRIGMDAVISAILAALIPDSLRIPLYSKLFAWYFARANDG
jgi:short-subunit dehydrogenase